MSIYPKLKIRYHREIFPDLKECESHGNFVDLYTAEQTILNAGESGLINLGISVQCPEGYVASDFHG
jgi:dUTPase